MRIRPFLSFVLFLSTPLLADTVYTYTGHPFSSNIIAPFTTSNYVRGSFTLASPLAPNTSYKWNPTSYIFTDGIDTFSQSFFHDASVNFTAKGNGLDPGAEFQVKTDGSGNIAQWNLIFEYVFHPSGSIDNLVTHNGFPLAPGDGSVNQQSPGGEGAVDFDPGTWTVTTPPVIRPFPSWDSQIVANLPPDFVPYDLLVDSTPVPEPQSLLLLTTGLLGGLVSIRRRIHA